MAMLSMKSEIFMTSRFRSGNNIQRPRRMTRPTHFIENDSLDPELTIAIQESLKIARQNEVKKANSGIASFENIISNNCITTASQTDLCDSQDELKRLLKANLNVIEHQQHALDAKDDEIRLLSSENEALQCRLERMERRISVLKQKDDSITVVSTLPLNTPHKTQSKRKSMTPPETYCKRLAAETCRLINKQHTLRKHKRSRRSASLSQDAGVSQTTETPVARRAVTKPVVDSLGDESAILTSLEEYHVLPCAAELRSPTIDTSTQSGCERLQEVEVPSWRVQIFKNIYQMEGTENITDEAYMRRHQKPELEEKRRKRWDLQRLREQEAYERLREKTDGTGSKAAGDITHTLYPSLNNISHIEVCDELPVSVFGRAIPSVEQSNFDLPWPSKKSKTPRRK